MLKELGRGFEQTVLPEGKRKKDRKHRMRKQSITQRRHKAMQSYDTISRTLRTIILDFSMIQTAPYGEKKKLYKATIPSLYS